MYITQCIREVGEGEIAVSVGGLETKVVTDRVAFGGRAKLQHRMFVVLITKLGVS